MPDGILFNNLWLLRKALSTQVGNFHLSYINILHTHTCTQTHTHTFCRLIKQCVSLWSTTPAYATERLGGRSVIERVNLRAR